MVKVVLADTHPYTDAFDLGLFLVLALLLGLFFHAVAVGTVVHNASHGRLSVRSYLDQIKAGLLGLLESLLGVNNPAILPLGVYKSYSRNAYLIVNARSFGRNRVSI